MERKAEIRPDTQPELRKEMTPMTQEVQEELIGKGYKAIDLVYLGHLPKEVVEAMTPEDFSEMADAFAAQDNKLLGC